MVYDFLGPLEKTNNKNLGKVQKIVSFFQFLLQGNGVANTVLHGWDIQSADLFLDSFNDNVIIVLADASLGEQFVKQLLRAFQLNNEINVFVT